MFNIINNLTLSLEQSDGIFSEFVFTNSQFLDNLDIIILLLSFINYVILTGLFIMFIVKKDFISMAVTLEVITLGIFLFYVVGSLFFGSCTGQIYSLFVLTLMVSEAAVGLSIIVRFFRIKQSIHVESATDVY